MVKDGVVVDVSDAVNSIFHQELHELINWLIAGFRDHKQYLIEAANERTGWPVAQVKLRSPMPKPFNVVAMAVNYMEYSTRT